MNGKGNTNVLIFNCGSSSLKYRLIRMPGEEEILSGEAQRIGNKTSQASRIIHREHGKEETSFVDMKDHKEAFDEVLKVIRGNPDNDIDVIAHRVVHGGDIFKENTMVDSDVVEKLKLTGKFAPLHNPPAVKLIEACYNAYPDLPQAVVFDTTFHATIPEYASVYPLPKSVTKELNIKKCGFHGTSHRYVAREAAHILGKPLSELNAVSFHLGSGGASLCAIVNGKSVDNTMGYSPLPGVVMNTRSGDIDPAFALQLAAFSGGGFAEMENILYKRSGVFGLSGKSADIRDVLAQVKADSGDEQQKLALQVYLWRIRKTCGAYMAVVGNPDAFIFTDTIGETVPEVRSEICAGMEKLGVSIDNRKNFAAAKLPADITAKGGRVRLLVIATNEELEIARETMHLFGTANLQRTTI